MTRPAPIVLKTFDGEYSVFMDLGAIDSIEQQTGMSALEINAAFVSARKAGRGLRVGLVYKFVVGAIASIEPTFPSRANICLDPAKIHDMVKDLAPAWNDAIRGIFGGDEPEKKEVQPSDPSTPPASSSESPPPTPG